MNCREGGTENFVRQKFLIAAALAGFGLITSFMPAFAASPSYQVEWVYHVKYGHQDEWWKIFRKYQIAILDREKQLGFVTDYYVDKPGLHTSEDARWDYRIIITYPNYDASRHEGEVQHQLFPDDAALTKEEDRRWELTVNHWDLPIHQIDPHAQD
jgi:hypothetical protein